MRWDPSHRSDDVIDARGSSGRAGMGGLLGLLPLLMRTRSPLLVLLVVGALIFFGGGLSGIFGGGRDDVSQTTTTSGEVNALEDRNARFVGFVLDDVQSVFRQKLSEKGVQYPTAKLVLFTDTARTGCGYGEAATGPFYCPADGRAYIDLSFYDELSRRFGASGDFAQAYVIAHEVGHHVQNVLGTSDKVHRASPSQLAGDHGLSVRLELQADCYAGVWAHETERRDLLEAGDVEEAMNAAAAVGDDRIQKQSSGRVSPESWTHGSSAQRAQWFHKGMESGDLAACDTFKAGAL